MNRSIALALLLAALFAVLPARAEKEPRVQRVYIFGFAASFTDSVACQTAVQQIDSAWIEPSHKFLVDRALYSLQLQGHMESVEKCKNPICTVFFYTNPKKAQRNWNRVRRRYEKADALRFTTLDADRFAFRAEEYRPIVVEPDTTPAPPKPTLTKAEKRARRRQAVAGFIVDSAINIVGGAVQEAANEAVDAILNPKDSKKDKKSSKSKKSSGKKDRRGRSQAK